MSLIILIFKLGKSPDVPSSYRPISLLPSLAKLCEKLILRRISKIINDKQVIPHTQFGFRNKHSAIHQVNHLTDAIAYSFERKLYCSAVLLDIAQAFDRIWHLGLLFKLRKILPSFYFFILQILS